MLIVDVVMFIGSQLDEVEIATFSIATRRHCRHAGQCSIVRLFVTELRPIFPLRLEARNTSRIYALHCELT